MGSTFTQWCHTNFLNPWIIAFGWNTAIFTINSNIQSPKSEKMNFSPFVFLKWLKNRLLVRNCTSNIDMPWQFHLHNFLGWIRWYTLIVKKQWYFWLSDWQPLLAIFFLSRFLMIHFLTLIRLVDPSILISWTSPFPILGVSGVLFHFYSISNRYSC